MKGSPFCAAELDCLGDYDQRGGNIASRGRAALLIVHNAQDRPLGPDPQHRFDEIPAVRRVYPSGAKNDVTRRFAPHRTLARLFAAPVDAEWIDRVILAVRALLSAIEDVIGRQM